jgi:hypothetical protein
MRYDIIHGEWDSFLNDDNMYDLIYLDPPFFTQRTHKMDKDGGEIFFDDIWNNLDEYKIWLINVFKTSWSKLTPNGLIYSHNNFEMNALLYSLLDENIRTKFMTNISWQRSHPHNNIKNSWGNIVDSIMVFSKTKKNFFNVQYSELDERYKNNSFNNKDENNNEQNNGIMLEKKLLERLKELNLKQDDNQLINEQTLLTDNSNIVDNSENYNQFFLIGEEKIKKIMTGGFFVRVKKSLERRSHNQNILNTIKVANFEITIR